MSVTEIIDEDETHFIIRINKQRYYAIKEFLLTFEKVAKATP